MNIDNVLRAYARQELKRLCPATHYWMRDHNPQADRELTEPLLHEPARFELTPRELAAAHALADLATYEIRSRAIWSEAFPVRDTNDTTEVGAMSEQQTREIDARREGYRRSALVAVVNESMQIANNSTNPETKVSRLELARAKLDALELLAAQHPFIKLQRLGAVRESIDLLAKEFAEAGYYARTDEYSRDYRQDVWKGIQMPIADVANGWVFSATIQVRTPLRVLLRHGEVHEGLSEPPAIAKEQWEGCWLPRLKTWRETGIDLPGSANLDGTMASDVGQIPRDGGDYLKALIRLRQVVESDLPIEQRVIALRDELDKADWADYCSKLGGRQAVSDRFFPPFISTIKGLPAVAVDSLRNAGLTTPNAIRAVADANLLAIKGIGPSKLRAIRQACAQARNQTSEFVDAVVR